MSLASRDPWQKIKGKEETEVLIHPALFCGDVLGWFRAGWVP